MSEKLVIKGFSALSKSEKIKLIATNHPNPEEFIKKMEYFWLKDNTLQQQIDEFSENTLSNFIFPFGIVPNVHINEKQYAVPVVIEESSVVAAAAHSARFWAKHGGFHASIIDNKKLGQIHFTWKGDFKQLESVFPILQINIRDACAPLTSNMQKRGGGILDIELLDLRDQMEDYYQIKMSFDTKDSMGANFINSILEESSEVLKDFLQNQLIFPEVHDCEVIMAILSNYTPDCKAKVFVECPIEELADISGRMTPETFAQKFKQAVQIANIDTYRATTHNKGIFNGIDSVVLATGNDFRAVEACGHTYASRSGKYRGYGDICIENGTFKYAIEIPIALGTVGGLTKLHPLAQLSLELLGNPSAEELMLIALTVGLANNFSAIRSLVTHGIQLGHMKMHLLNILNSMNANDDEKLQAIEYFKNHKVSVVGVKNFLNNLKH